MPQVNRKPPNKVHDQHIRFKRSKWTKEQQRSWLVERDKFTDGFHRYEKWDHWRQYDPNGNKYDYRYQNRGDGVQALIGLPKE